MCVGIFAHVRGDHGLATGVFLDHSPGRPGTHRGTQAGALSHPPASASGVLDCRHASCLSYSWFMNDETVI